MKKIVCVLVVLLLFPTSFIFSSDNSTFPSDNMSLPNKFNSGETISSSEMNENFEELVEEIKKFISIPIVGIGGINLTNQHVVYQSGCSSVAMIEGLFMD